jgi:CRISPR type III-associated protein (TIGR04423 family)
MTKNQTQIIEYINSLMGYQGYIQMSGKPIIDIWKTFSDISFAPTSGFVYEAYFYNGTDSIAIKQINDSWLVDKTNKVPLNDTRIYFAKDNLEVKMAQIWHEVDDELCENMKVLKLKKIVFAGFVEAGEGK